MNGKNSGAYRAERETMVKHQIQARGVKNPYVLDAMTEVPRHLFVPEEGRSQSYEDHPIEIGEGQTISQPYIVALMLEAVDVKPGSVLLEVGSGSGYLAAVASRICSRVYGIERLPELEKKASGVLKELGYDNVEITVGDGTLGREEKAPFDGIIVSAGAPEVPPALTAQLKPGGTLLIPVGTRSVQKLLKIRKDERGVLQQTDLGDVRFVSLIGKEGW